MQHISCALLVQEMVLSDRMSELMMQNDGMLFTEVLGVMDGVPIARNGTNFALLFAVHIPVRKTPYSSGRTL